MTEPSERARRTGPRELGVAVTPRYRFMRWGTRLMVRVLFEVRAEGLERWPAAPFCLVLNHHNGWDPLLVIAVTPTTPRVTWFGPKEADFSRGFKNRLMGFFGGVIPYDPAKTTLTSAVRAVRRVFAAGGVLGIFAEGHVGFAETDLLPFEDGAVAFASASGVPIVPCAMHFGDPISTTQARSREARSGLEDQVRGAILALLPGAEPRLPRRRPLRFLGDLLSGADDLARRRAELGE